MFSLLAGVVAASLALSSNSAKLSCSDLWNPSSTSSCEIPVDYINDNDCDCDDCSDELYWNCNTCREGCASCGIFNECPGTTYYTNLNTDCNFYFEGSLPIVEGECYSYDLEFGPFVDQTSSMMTCNDNNEAIVTYYNDSIDCTNVNGMYTKQSNIYSCGGSKDNCDKYTLWYDGYAGNDTGACNNDKNLILSVYAVIANLGCVDGVDYDISESGINYGYFFDQYNMNGTSTCDGEPDATNNVEAKCNAQSGGISLYLTIEAGINGEPGGDSPRTSSNANSLNIINKKFIIIYCLLVMLFTTKL